MPGAGAGKINDSAVGVYPGHYIHSNRGNLWEITNSGVTLNITTGYEAGTAPDRIMATTADKAPPAHIIRRDCGTPKDNAVFRHPMAGVASSLSRS